MRKLLAAGAVGFWLAAAPIASADEPYNWNGFYIGIQGGGDWGDTDVKDPYNGIPYGGDIYTNGFFAGLEAGYNFQSAGSPWVFGIEGDFDFADTDGTTTCNALFTNVISANCRSSQDRFATLAARIGHTWGAEGRTLTFLKIGGAMEHNDLKITNNDSPFFFPPTTNSDTTYGWTLGIGLEQALTPAWSLKAEYDYMKFKGDAQMPDTVATNGPFLVPGLDTDVHASFGFVKLGLNYKIGEDPWSDWGGGLLGTDGMHGVLAGWSFESGTRYWLSGGKFQWDVGLLPPDSVVNDTLISRLTYHSQTANSAELFENVQTPWNIFAKATIGIGGMNDGEDNDEDWNFGGADAYSNTISHDHDGHISYGNIDLGYNFLTGQDFRIGAFVGFSTLEERWESFGCFQIADPNLGCSPPFSDQFPVGTENVRWDAVRLGLDGNVKVGKNWSFNANLAYLPYAEMTGRDNHLLRDLTFGADQAGTGEGVQLEGSINYQMTSAFSMGLGGRYWAYWTRDSAGDSDFEGGGAGHSIFFLGDRYDLNRWGGFVQAAWNYDAKDDDSAFHWADNGSTGDQRWAGWYVGLHTGAGWGTTNVNDPDGAPIFGNDVSISAFVGGIQAGFNWNDPGSSLVYGIEADANLAGDDGTRTCLAHSGTFISSNCNSQPNAMGTLTGRIGELFGSSGRTLVYGKAGLSWIQNDFNITANNIGTPPTGNNDWKIGWAAGLGVEQALTPGLSVKLEYEYMGFGSTDVATPETGDYTCFCIVPGTNASYDENFQMVQIGLNYKLGADPLSDWNGAGIPFHNAFAGWSFEMGTRAYVSLGKFQWDHFSGPTPDGLVSRLTYDQLTGYSAELFERLDTPWHLFAKGYIGLGGIPSGVMNDEDWNIGVGYSNTISHEGNGRMSYAVADVGYDVLTGDGYKAGLFVGYSYDQERVDSRGCDQIAGAAGLCLPPFDDFFIVGTETTYWQALRVGIATENRLFDRFKLKTDLAYLPYAELYGARDNHLLRTDTTFINQKGTGEGVQLDASLDYMVTDAFSVGVGGRYWAMWTNDGYDQFSFGGGGLPSDWFGGEKYSMERFGAFLQTSFKWGEMPPVEARQEPPPTAIPTPKHFIVFFGYNKCNITAEADQVLSEAASAAKSTGSAHIDIVGHTDTSGSAKYNQKLSECRANAAKSNLVGKGIAAGSISTMGKGETELMVQTGDGVKEPQNRRATIDLQ
jgi:opacity protein-like surface antigen/outer membrane protein OmpA-like peptidoglycan-associated protein